MNAYLLGWKKNPTRPRGAANESHLRLVILTAIGRVAMILDTSMCPVVYHYLFYHCDPLTVKFEEVCLLLLSLSDDHCAVNKDMS